MRPKSSPQVLNKVGMDNMNTKNQELRFGVKPKYKPKPNKRWGIIIEHKKEKNNENT